jgi:hypothetical protein
MNDLKEGKAIWIRKLTTAQQWAHEARQRQEESPQMLLEEYERHRFMFDESEATRFPPKREEELAMDLLPGAPNEIDCKVYPLSRTKQDQLCTFLREEEEKGYIYQESSPYMAPVFLIGKKDSEEKRVVTDYWKLNEWVIWDNGPLPNI